MVSELDGVTCASSIVVLISAGKLRYMIRNDNASCYDVEYSKTNHLIMAILFMLHIFITDISLINCV